MIIHMSERSSMKHLKKAERCTTRPVAAIHRLTMSYLTRRDNKSALARDSFKGLQHLAGVQWK
jgi:hypothetical protein